MENTAREYPVVKTETGVPGGIGYGIMFLVLLIAGAVYYNKRRLWKNKITSI